MLILAGPQLDFILQGTTVQASAVRSAMNPVRCARALSRMPAWCVSHLSLSFRAPECVWNTALHVSTKAHTPVDNVTLAARAAQV